MSETPTPSPITLHCKNCQARPSEPCTQPTDTGRRNVSWFHDARQDLADSTLTCDHGDHPVHLDRNGYWVGEDETSDCPDNEYPARPGGHMVDGRIRG